MNIKVSKTWTCGIVALTVLILVSAGCARPQAEPEAEVVYAVSGSGTTTAILKGVKEAFEADNPGYRLSVLPGAGTGGGVQGVVERGLDVAAMARPPKDKEKEQGVEWTQIGESAGPVLAHPGVGVANLSTAQVTAIFSGEITNWSEVGGANLKIMLFVRDAGDSSTQAVRETIFGETPFSDSAELLISQSDMQEKVAETPGAVGYGSWPAAVAAGSEIVGLALNGVAPNDAAFPIASPVGIGYLAERKAEMQPLIDWLLSDKGQEALRGVELITTQ